MDELDALRAQLAASQAEVQRVTAERDALEQRCVERMTEAHGLAQESTVRDVNEGRLDNLIAPRLQRERAKVERLRSALRELPLFHFAVTGADEPEHVQTWVKWSAVAALLDGKEP